MTLWSSDFEGFNKSGVCVVVWVVVIVVFECFCCWIHGYRIKPHGQLVRVSLTHYCASTPRLSTLWSSTTLEQARGLREVSS